MKKLLTLWVFICATVYGAYVPPATIGDLNTGTSRSRAVYNPVSSQYVGEIFRPKDYVVSDGFTTNRAIVQVSETRGNLAGAARASWVGWIDVPSSPGSLFLFALTSAYTAPFANNSITARASGGLTITAAGANGATDRRNFTSSTFFSTYGGQRIWLDVRFTKGASDPSVFVNGTDISSSFIPSISGSLTPEWLDANLVATYQVTGYSWPSGTAPLGCWLNAHLTNAESEAWRTTGRPPAWVMQGGAMRDYVSNFTTVNTDNWSSNNANNTRTSNVDQDADGVGIPPSNDWLRISKTVSAGTTDTLRISGRIRYIGATNSYKGDIFVPSTFPTGLALGVRRGGLDYAILTPLTPGTTTSFNLTVANTNTSIYDILGICNLSGSLSAPVDAGTSWYLKNLVIDTGGALSLPTVQPIPVIADATIIGNNFGRLVGMIPYTDKKNFRIVGSTAVNGNTRILDGPVFDAKRVRLDSWTILNVGLNANTVSLGNVSGGSQYVSGGNATVSLFDPTLLTRYPTTTELWINSTGASQLIHTITGTVINN